MNKSHWNLLLCSYPHPSKELTWTLRILFHSPAWKHHLQNTSVFHSFWFKVYLALLQWSAPSSIPLRSQRRSETMKLCHRIKKKSSLSPSGHLSCVWNITVTREILSTEPKLKNLFIGVLFPFAHVRMYHSACKANIQFALPSTMPVINSLANLLLAATNGFKMKLVLVL